MHTRTCLLLVLTATALTCAALAGCGQTGALYLPAKEGEVVSKGPDGVTTSDPAADAEAARKRAQPATPNPAPQ